MTFSTIYSIGDNEFSSTHFQRIQYRLEFFFNTFLKISLVTPLNEIMAPCYYTISLSGHRNTLYLITYVMGLSSVHINLGQKILWTLEQYYTYTELAGHKLTNFSVSLYDLNQSSFSKSLTEMLVWESAME